jgi:hypothetical protein
LSISSVCIHVSYNGILFTNKNDRRVTQSDFLLGGDTASGVLHSSIRRIIRTFYLEDKSKLQFKLIFNKSGYTTRGDNLIISLIKKGFPVFSVIHLISITSFKLRFLPF